MTGAAPPVVLPPDTIAALDHQARTFVRDLATLSPLAPDFSRKADGLAFLGRAEMADASGLSNRYLGRPLDATGRDAAVAKDMSGLRALLKQLDPQGIGEPSRRDGWFGRSRPDNALPVYFDRYTAAQPAIVAAFERLTAARDALLQDNVAIAIERQNLRAALARLQQMVHLAKGIDTGLASAAAELSLADPARAKAIREEPLFHIRQRVRDLMTQMAVSMQGYQALELIEANNAGLVAGLNQTLALTASALRTASVAAQTLTGQRLMFDSIAAVGSAAARIADIAGTPGNAPLAELQQAFENAYIAMDDCDRLRAKAVVDS